VTKKKSITTAGWIFGLLAVFFLIIWFRIYVGSKQDYGRGMGFLERHETIRAITYFDRSLHWYAPWNPYVEKSAQRLWEIGNRAREQGETKTAIIAFQSIRQGFYAARSLWTPGKEWIRKCDMKINDMTVGQARGAPEVTARNQAQMGPSIFWSAVVGVSLLGWVGSVIGFLVAGRRGKHPFQHKTSETLLWTALFLGFFVAWVLAMMKA
jgi:hypothetical protein